MLSNNSTISTSREGDYFVGVSLIGSKQSSFPDLPDVFFRQVTSLDPISLPDLTAPARERLDSVADIKMAQEARNILDKLRNRLLQEGDVNHFPPIRLFEGDDNSLLIEWIFPHHRIGFGIENKSEDSGWYFVSDEQAGRINAAGFLSGVNVDWLVNWLVYAATNSSLLND